MRGYEPLGWRTTTAALFISLSVVGNLAVDLSGMAFAGQIEEKVSAALIVLAAAIMLLVSLLLGVIFFLVWMHRAATNLRAFNRAGLEYTPGWCVGWWFIPFANLVKPFRAMQEIWRASDPQLLNGETEPHWRTAAVPGLLGGWWAAYLIGNLINNAAVRIEAEPLSSQVGFAGTVFLGASAWFVARIMREIDQRQQALARRLQLSQPTGTTMPST